jgi:Cu(I)/Ag(I) efflux system membrane fusion protein
MHPQVVQSEPGSCPICGMDLTPLQPGGAQGDVVQIDPGVVQQIGVETAPVERTSVYRHLRTIGEVEVGEDALSVVNLRYSGWAERVYVDKTGDRVQAGQALFEIYSPELVAAREEYLLALRARGAEDPLARAARRKLELWGLAAWDLDRLAEAGEASRTVPVRATAAGYVLHKDLVEGGRVRAGQDLYRLGDLQRIWVTSEVYEHDAPWVEVGQPAQMELSHLPGRAFEGEVSYIYPTLDPDTRTLTVRLEFDNPGVQLKPGMFATVYIQSRRLDDVVAVPTSAVLHSGRRQLVFVALGQGRFEPREVVTGLQGDHRMTEVIQGLAPGEEVVVSSQFLIDSESQLQEALARLMAGAASAPGAAVRADRGDQDHSDQHEGTARPGQYSCPMHPEVISDEPGRCPDCGMFLEQVPEAP